MYYLVIATYHDCQHISNKKYTPIQVLQVRNHIEIINILETDILRLNNNEVNKLGEKEPRCSQEEKKHVIKTTESN